MIGSGIFLMPTALAAYGSISLLGWLCSAAGAIILARVFGKISKYMPYANGGPYAYTHKAFGSFAAFIIAWGYYISILTANAAITISLISALSTFFPVLGTSVFAAIATGLCAIWLLSLINNAGIKAGATLQLITTVIKIIPLLLIGIAGLFFMSSKNFAPFNTTGKPVLAVLTTVVSYIFFSFQGVESATIPAANIKTPERIIAKATTIGTLLTTLVYLLASISIMGLIPNKQLQQSVTPFADAATIIWGGNSRYLISAGVAIAGFGALNGWILLQGQVPAAMAADKLFPSIFTRQNKNGVPWLSIIISSVFVSLFLIMNFTKGLVDKYKFLILLSSLAALVPYLFTAASYLKLSKGFKKITAAVYLLGISTFLFCLWAIIGTGAETILWGLMLYAIAVPFYFITKQRN
jgi:basic amino acid/polyamine antiporter, APA family